MGSEGNIMSKKYSDWFRIDLHIHTDKSRETKDNDYQGNFSVETLHKKLIENEVQIFSLTDHNIINVDVYKEYYETYNNEIDPLLLIGVELDIEVQNESSNKLYHSLLIFNYYSFDKAEEINGKLESKYSEKGLNLKERKLTIEEVAELFSDDDFFFIPHADGHRNIVSAYTDVGIGEAQKMVLLMPSALEKVTKEERRKAYSRGFSQLLTESFREQDDIPYIEFSDNHNIEQYPKRHKGSTEQENHKFYYIKGGKNYETIRLAFIDPRSRIKSQAEYDEIDKISNKIEKLKIVNESKIEDVEIFFSPHLNVIIGGRSSGKSLLMNILGSKIDKVTIKSYYKVSDENFLIKAKDDDNYKDKISIGSNFLYINQGDIVRYFEHNDLKSMAKDSGRLEDYENAKGKISSKKQNLEERFRNLIDAYGNLIDIGNQTKYELHKSTIDRIFSKEFVLKLDEEELNNKHLHSDKITQAITLVSDLKEKTEEFKSNAFYEFSEQEEKTIDDFLSLVEKKQTLANNKKQKDTKKSNFLQSVKKLIDSKNGSLSQGAQEKAEAVRKLETLKNDIKDKFDKAIALKKQADIIESENYNTEESINVSEDVSLVLSVELSRDIKDVFISDVINSGEQEKSLYLNLLGLFKGNKPIKNIGGNSKEKLSKKINTVFNDVYKKFDKPEDYLRYSDETTSKENSPGLNSEKYLEVVLSNETIKMIFIDQPEDNLGNKFISERLVEIIRDIKFNKQIFLVTHNPAIAVYGDAECIIIAENTDKIRYKQIVLEDKNSQKEVCRVLDGGEYIFDNRSRKYDIQRILREVQNG
jgi:hypothetical protein